MQALAADVGMTRGVKLFLDSSAALSLATRKGMGRAKHIEMQHMWLQDATAKNRVQAMKIGTDNNPSDLMTKPLTRERVDYLMTVMGYKFKQ